MICKYLSLNQGLIQNYQMFNYIIEDWFFFLGVKNALPRRDLIPYLLVSITTLQFSQCL